MIAEIEKYKKLNLKAKDSRLLEEWELIMKRFSNNEEIEIFIRERNPNGLPIDYEIKYKIRSFCGITEKDENGLQHPLFANEFTMRITIPKNFPSCDSKPYFCFMTEDILEINKIPNPWHPNIQYYGDFPGKVCINEVAFGTFADLALFIERIALYLKYEKYHAVLVEPYPQDLKVAEWVREQAEPNGWIEELKNNYQVSNINNN
ncbi:MAG: hypothetical protein ACOYO1_00665 [Bacteroidales bacterium]